MSSNGNEKGFGYRAEIRQIMPATDWVVMTCWIREDDTMFFEEVPVVGWAIVHFIPLNGRGPRADEVRLLVQRQDASEPQWLEDAQADDVADVDGGSLTQAFGPGIITDEIKTMFEKRTRYSIRMRQGLEA